MKGNKLPNAEAVKPSPDQYTLKKWEKCGKGFKGKFMNL